MCPCTEPGWCEEYKRHMTEQQINFCKDDSEKGRLYRQAWSNAANRDPSLFRKAINLAVAATKHIVDGLRKTPEGIYHERLALCMMCDELQPDGTCRQCGCPVETKCKWASESCPLDPPKWRSVSDEKKGGCGSCGS